MLLLQDLEVETFPKVVANYRGGKIKKKEKYNNYFLSISIIFRCSRFSRFPILQRSCFSGGAPQFKIEKPRGKEAIRSAREVAKSHDACHVCSA